MRRLLLTFCYLALPLLLAACSQQQLPSVTLPGDVEGTVVDMLGGGVGGMNVAVGNKITVTGSNGGFTLENIESPYDLVTYSSDTGHLIEGVTSFAPTVIPVGVLSGDLLAGIDTATVSGSLGETVPTDHEARICVEGLDTVVVGCTSALAGESAYVDLTASWTDGGPVDVRVHVLFIEVDATTGLPTGYGSYGTETATITAGGTPIIDVTLGAAPGETTAGVSVTLPAGVDLSDLFGTVRLNSDFVLPVFQAAGTLPTDLNIPLPRLGQQSYQFVAQGQDSGSGLGIAWAHDVAAGGSTTLDIPEPPTFTTPGDAATGITPATPFTIDVASEGINTFFFESSSATFGVTTTDKSSTMPDLTLYGLPVPASTSFFTQAIHVPIGDANDITSRWLSDYVDLALAIYSGGPGPGRDGALSATSIDVTTQ